MLHGSHGVVVTTTLLGAHSTYGYLIAAIALAIIKICVNKDFAVMRLIEVEGCSYAQSVKPKVCLSATGVKIYILHLGNRVSN